jgi:hypothetical protein
VDANALARDAFEEIAQLALPIRRELFDVREVEKAAAGVLPQGGRVLEELIGGEGGKGAVGTRAELVEGAGGEQFACARLALDGGQTKMGCGAAHAGEKVLHDGAAAHHGAERGLANLETFRLERFRDSEVEGNRFGILQIGLGFGGLGFKPRRLRPAQRGFVGMGASHERGVHDAAPSC